MTTRHQVSIAADGSETITAFVNGKLLVAADTHANYAEIKAALEALNPLDADWRTDDEIIDLFDVTMKIGTKLRKLSRNAGISGGVIYWKGAPVHNAIADQIFRYIQEGVEDWRSLEAFWTKLDGNQNPRSREQAYNWLSAAGFTISVDGDIIAYKGVNADFTSKHAGPGIVNGEFMTGNLPNNPGNVIELALDDIDDDPNSTCSFGLHAATFEFAQSFAGVGGKVVKLKINPADIVSVPVDANGQKMRVRLYEVVEEVEGAVPTAIDYSLESEYDDWDPDWDLDEDYYDEDDYSDETEAILADDDTLAAIEEAQAENNSKWEALKSRFGIGR